MILCPVKFGVEEILNILIKHNFFFFLVH